MSRKTITLALSNLVGPYCVAEDDGKEVFEQIKEALRSGQTVMLSFHGVEVLTSAFLHPAVGQLYGSFDEAFVRTHLKAEGIRKSDADLLKQVVEYNKAYYRDPEEFQRLQAEAVAESV